MVDDADFDLPPPQENSEMIEDKNDENRPPPRLMITKMVRHLLGMVLKGVVKSPS